MAATNFTPIQLYYSTTASAAPVAGNLASGELAINITDGKLYYKDNGGIVQLLASSSGASGNVVGPASSTDNAISRFDGTTGKLIQNSVVTIADTTGNMAGVGTLGVGAITTSGALVGAVSQDAFNTVSTTLNIGGAATTLNIGAATGTLTVANATLAAKAVTATAITNSALTATRLVYSGTAGLEVDSANLTFNGTDLTVSGAVNAGSINATTLDLTNLEVTNIKAKDGTASIALADTTGIATFSKATVISTTDNTNAALRITQLGTGNALLVEDSGNPDSTPVVIDASGNIIQGYTSQITSGSSQRNIQSVGTSNNTGFSGIDYTNDATTNALLGLFKSRGGTINTYTTVNSGDRLGIINWGGADGTAFVNAARIEAYVDGTPGTNDMPGRLVFSTTADGASSPTERMRIDSAGRVGIGSTPTTGASVNITSNITGATAISSVVTNGVVQSDVTVQANYFNTSVATQAAAFTLTDLRHYNAAQVTIGATSAVTNQYGFAAQLNITGATNNYGFYSNIASGTNRYNFYAAGTAVNYFAGNVGIGTTSPGYTLQVSGSLGVTGTTTLGATVNTGLGVSTGDATIELGTNRTGDGNAYIDFHSTASSDYELRVSRASGVNGNTIFTSVGAGNFTLQQQGAGTMIFSTNAAERMRLDSSGNLGIGATANASAILDAQSTTKGVRMPNMTTTQKNAIATPAAGLMVFDTTLAKLCVYTGAAWQTITSV